MAARRDGPSAGDISRMLAHRVRDLVHKILPGGRDEAGEWVVLNPTRADRNPGSFRINLSGSRQGVWADFATDDRGDALDLVAYVLYAGDVGAAIAWSKNWLGLGDGPVPAAVLRDIPPPMDDEAKAAEMAKRKANALRIWLGAQPSLKDTPAAAYLARRGIDLAQLGRQPRALRFHPQLWNVESKAHWPALVAAVCDAQGTHVATHRIWLALRDGRWGKAPLKEAKMAIGVLWGGSIRLWRGASGRPLGEAPEGDQVAIAEGIETALSVAIACPELRVLCAVSGGNMKNIALPPAVSTVFLCGDNDPGNADAASKLHQAIARYQSEGRDVRVAMPAIEGADWNDILQGVDG